MPVPRGLRGIWGYVDFLEAIRDPKHPEHEEMLEWVGGEFDPDAFDLEEVNTELNASHHLKWGEGSDNFADHSWSIWWVSLLRRACSSAV